jgi:hypothetical protein
LFTHLTFISDGKAPQQAVTAQRAVKLSDSAKLLYDIVHRLITDVKALLAASAHVQTTADLYAPIVQGVVRMFERYLLKMTEAMRRLDAGTLRFTVSVF